MTKKEKRLKASFQIEMENNFFPLLFFPHIELNTKRHFSPTLRVEGVVGKV